MSDDASLAEIARVRVELEQAQAHAAAEHYARQRIIEGPGGPLWRACLADGWTVAELDAAFERRFGRKVARDDDQEKPMIRLRVKEVAEQAGIPDAAELSRRTGVSTDTAYRLWRGEIGGVKRGQRSIGIATLHRVAKALGVQMSDLYTEEDRHARLTASLGTVHSKAGI